MNAKLYGLRVCSYLFLKFNSNLLWTCDNCYPNSLRPSFLTHSLQIYCLELIGPLYYTFGPQIETLHLVFLILLKKISFFFFPFLAVYCHSLSLNLPYIGFLFSFSSDFWVKFVKCIYVSITFLLSCMCLFLKIKLKI